MGTCMTIGTLNNSSSSMNAGFFHTVWIRMCTLAACGASHVYGTGVLNTAKQNYFFGHCFLGAIHLHVC